MKNEIRNCRGCTCSYVPSEDKIKDSNFKTKNEYNLHYTDSYQCIIRVPKLEPVGFCDHCDKNNPVWYNSNLKCKYEEKI